MRAFLTSHWRGLLIAVALVVLGTVLLSSADNYIWSRYQQRTNSKRIESTATNRAARVATEAPARSRFDSTFYSLAGQRREQARQLTISKKADDSLTRLLPAAPELPARPPRY